MRLTKFGLVPALVSTMVEGALSATDVREELEKHVAGMTAEGEVETLTSILQNVLNHQRQRDTLARVVWERLTEGERWRASFQSLEALELVLGDGEQLESIVARSIAHERRLTQADTVLRTSWDCSLASVFPPNQAQPEFSKHFLENVMVLVRMSTKAEGLECLQRARQNRMLRRRSRNTHQFIPTDLKEAIEELGARTTAQLRTAELEASVAPESTEFDPRPAGNSCACSCPKDLLPEVLGGMSNVDREEKDRICGILREQGSQLCHRHLRGVMGKLLGMGTNHSNEVLQDRMQKYLHARKSGTERALRTRMPGWFLGGSRHNKDHALLGMWKFKPTDNDIGGSITFNPRKIFERHAPPGAYDRWLVDGTVILDGIFHYLMSSPEIFALIDREFDLYKYHTREGMHGKKRNGWIRTMFYAVIQQVVRQDPVCYALNVASRPDMNFRLISYPYYTKDTTAGENTGFKHLDLNVPRLLSEGRGINIVQCSVSVDNEESDGCTIVVPGFHRNIRQWWSRVEDRGNAANGLTTCASKIYTREDEEDFGCFIPTPCPRGGIRITRPDILHGSTPVSRLRRRTILPCYIAVSPDHDKLENEECETWGQLSHCHRTMEAPTLSTSGFGFAYGGPGIRFPAGVLLESSSAIGDAISCLRRWDDALVVEELGILFGTNDTSALQYVQRVRQRLVDSYLRAVKAVFEMERKHYGVKSFAHCGSFPDSFNMEDEGSGDSGLTDSESHVSNLES